MKIDHMTKTLHRGNAVREDILITSSDALTKSDSDLVVEVLAGSEAALATLHARHHRFLRSIIHRYMNSENEVDEVIQDVFLYVWNNAGSFSDDKGRFIGWLATITSRRSLDRVRKRSSYQRAMTRLEEEGGRYSPQSRSSWIVDKEVRQHELQVLITSHLKLLPWQQCEVVKLSYFSGLSQRQIANRLSLPLGTVKTRLQLGIDKLSRSGLRERAA